MWRIFVTEDFHLESNRVCIYVRYACMYIYVCVFACVKTRRFAYLQGAKRIS